jgi:septum formation topological specificity factor MinE
VAAWIVSQWRQSRTDEREGLREEIIADLADFYELDQAKIAAQLDHEEVEATYMDAAIALLMVDKVIRRTELHSYNSFMNTVWPMDPSGARCPHQE